MRGKKSQLKINFCKNVQRSEEKKGYLCMATTGASGSTTFLFCVCIYGK